MTIADDVAVTAAASSIVEVELRRMNRIRAAGCTAIALMLVAAIALLFAGLVTRSPVAFLTGVGAFVAGLAVATRVDGPPVA